MLYIVATAIGNIEDITLRAIRILKTCDYVLAEDTRRTKKLFTHYNIKNKLVSYNDVNKKRKTPTIIADLKLGKDISLVSDSGTPGISDPGFYLVRECVKNNLSVSPIPGPNAAISALICSGLPTDKFTFYGFLPKNKTKRKKILKDIKSRKETVILYESPYRILKTIKEISEKFPNKQTVIAREMTKKFEEFIHGKSSKIYETVKNKKLKGEFVILIY
jgi:16S rRNA (cytidine1402-2'-O)-methyltransferase